MRSTVKKTIAYNTTKITRRAALKWSICCALYPFSFRATSLSNKKLYEKRPQANTLSDVVKFKNEDLHWANEKLTWQDNS